MGALVSSSHPPSSLSERNSAHGPTQLTREQYWNFIVVKSVHVLGTALVHTFLWNLSEGSMKAEHEDLDIQDPESCPVISIPS